MTQLDGEYDLVLGKSFTNPEEVSYSTFRYDFKPASLDTTKPGLVNAGPGQDITVTLPNNSSNAASNTVFKGNKRPTQKECVLIYNKKTGKMVLERVHSAIQLKKTRIEEKKQPQIKRKSGPNVSGLESESDSDASNSSPMRPAGSVSPQIRKSVKTSHVQLTEDLRLSESGSDSE